MTTRKKSVPAALAPKYVAIHAKRSQWDEGRGATPPFSDDDEDEFNCVWFETPEAAGAWAVSRPSYTVYEIGPVVQIQVSISVKAGS